MNVNAIAHARDGAVASYRLLGLYFVRCLFSWLVAALAGTVLFIHGAGWTAAAGVTALGLVPLCAPGSLRRLTASFRLAVSLISSFSLPRRELLLQGTDGAIAIHRDRYGIPAIVANSHADALYGLGYCHGRDRLFQMDALRRSTLGRTAEIMGTNALPSDVIKRRLSLGMVARTAYQQLDPSDRLLLVRYAAGVNRAADEQRKLPFEARLLGYAVEAWQPEDALSVALFLFHELTFDYDNKRNQVIMRACLSDRVLRLLTSGQAECGSTGGSSQVLREANQDASAAASPHAHRPAAVEKSAPCASNLWALSRARSTTGQGILCNDLHLPLSVPNIFFCARLRFANFSVAGVQVPGLPITLVGTNGLVSWGVANLGSSCLDLVRIEPEEVPGAREAPAGTRPSTVREETIAIRTSDPVTIAIEESPLGPVMERDLLGSPIAARWTALMDRALSLDLMHLFACRTVQQALELAARSGGPPLSFCVASDTGEIGRTISGRVPNRQEAAGELQHAEKGDAQSSGVVGPNRLPTELNPPEGIFVSANQKLYAFQHADREAGMFSDGARARRARHLLLAQPHHSAARLQHLQLDIQCTSYLFYRDLVLSLEGSASGDEDRAPWLRQLLEDARAWDGAARAQSTFFAFLHVFRQRLADYFIDLYARPCFELAQHFTVSRSNVDSIIRAILSGQAPPPDSEQGPASDNSPPFSQPAIQSLLRSHAQQAYASVYTGRGRKRRPVVWGTLNASALNHPLSGSLRADAAVLDMPSVRQDGCSDTLRVAEPTFGSAGRFILVSGSDRMYLQMPGGQSGHPLSRHYRDMNAFWSRGEWISVALQ